MFDREGCGGDKRSREELEGIVQSRLDSNGWHGRASVVAIDPELEAWVWSNSPEVDAALGWGNRNPQLREWMVAEGLLEAGAVKPGRPKEAVERALFESRQPRSSALYGRLAKRVSFDGCADPAFRKLRDALARWFPAPVR